jgi:hypothetical protein
VDAATISAIAACVAAAGAVAATFHSIVNGKAINEVHLSINSRLTELITAATAQARSEGHAEGAASVDPAIAALAAERVLQVAREKAAP